MSQGPMCPHLTKKVQKEVSEMANCNLSCVMLLGGLSVNLNHLKRISEKHQGINGKCREIFIFMFTFTWSKHSLTHLFLFPPTANITLFKSGPLNAAVWCSFRHN